ncbi:MAG: hypothetical protein Q9M23_08700 [Mariprofundaceae bacterium]|nr:hypothetical protein [Mariprofundaceae bacterium]
MQSPTKGCNNITEPETFNHKLQQVMIGIYDLLELSRAEELPPVSEDGVIRYDKEGKTCFQVSGQFERPTEFLQTLLDMVRVNFEPCIFGTFQLNSNMGFMYDEIPVGPFQLGYVSMTSGNNQEFGDFWNNTFIPYIEKCGYDFSQATAIFAAVSTSEERHTLDLLDDVSMQFACGFSMNEALDLIASSINDDISQPGKQTHAGYCVDPALDGKVRLSLWFFIQHDEHHVH